MLETLGSIRDDLLITPRSQGALTTYKVVDPAGKVEFQFHEVEFAVASSLDGRRNIDEVVEAVRARGFSVSAAQVKAFYRELKGMGFVREGAAGQGPAAAAVGNHSSDAQSFLKQGLAYLAEGKFDFARSNLEAALELDPENALIKRALAECAAPPSAAPAPASLPTEPTPTPVAAAAARNLVLPISVGVGAAVLAVTLLYVLVLEPRSAPPPALPVAAVATPAPAPSPAPAPTAAALEAVVTAVSRPVLARVVSPGPAQLVRYLVREGDSVAPGTKIAQLSALLRPKGKAPPVEDSAHLRELEELAKQDPEYEVFLERERKKTRAPGSREALRFNVVAPSRGLFVPLLTAGASIARGQTLAEIRDASAMSLGADFEASGIEPSWACTVVLPNGELVSCLIEEVVARGSGVRLSATARPPRGGGLLPSGEVRLRVRPPG